MLKADLIKIEKKFEEIKERWNGIILNVENFFGKKEEESEKFVKDVSLLLINTLNEEIILSKRIENEISGIERDISIAKTDSEKIALYSQKEKLEKIKKELDEYANILSKKPFERKNLEKLPRLNSYIFQTMEKILEKIAVLKKWLSNNEKIQNIATSISREFFALIKNEMKFEVVVNKLNVVKGRISEFIFELNKYISSPEISKEIRNEIAKYKIDIINLWNEFIETLWNRFAVVYNEIVLFKKVNLQKMGELSLSPELFKESGVYL